MTSDTNSDTASILHKPTDRSDTNVVGSGGQSEDLGTTIVLEVAKALDTEPTELSPSLYELVDPDALDALFEAASDGSEVHFTILLGDVQSPSSGTAAFSSRLTTNVLLGPASGHSRNRSCQCLRNQSR